jgi:hypothetical protein
MRIEGESQIWLKAAKAYQLRYEEATGLLYARPGQHFTAFEAIAAQLEHAPEGMDAAMDKTMDTFFADDWAKGAGWPPTALSKSLIKYYSPPQEEPAGPDLEDRSRYVEEDLAEVFK